MKKLIALAFIASLTLSTMGFAQDKMKKDKMSSSKMNDDKMTKDKMADDKMTAGKMANDKPMADKMSGKKMSRPMKKDKMKPSN